jgi:hypothetical protein
LLPYNTVDCRCSVVFAAVRPLHPPLNQNGALVPRFRP